MKPGIDPKVDFAFKWLFGNIANAALLIDLLNAVLKPPVGRRIEWIDIMNPFNDKDALDDKLSILDIRARDDSGRYFNIEMQMAVNRVFPNRVLYYWSILHSIQLDSKDKYERLKPTISISFVDGILFPSVPDYHLEFGARSTKYSELTFSPHLVVHVIELPKFKLAAQDLTDPLERWCYFLIHGQEFDTQALPETLLVEPVQKAMEVMEMLAQTKEEWLNYQNRLKAIRDLHSREVEAAEDREKAIGEAIARGEALGIQKGEALGIQKGEALGIRKFLVEQIHHFQQSLGNALTPLVELDRLEITELKAMTYSLAAQSPKK